jgi:hypothetical protein
MVGARVASVGLGCVGFVCVVTSFSNLAGCACRFDFKAQQYVAGILEEDDPTHPELQLIKTPARGGRTFTIYLYDREKHQVRPACLFTAVGCELWLHGLSPHAVLFFYVL